MALVVEYHEELESDLLKQGVDLLDFWRGKITPRRMNLLIDHLPADSEAKAKARPREAVAESWSTEAYLQALLVDMFGAANFKNWQPLKRPSDAFDERDQADRAAAFLAAQAERNRQREAAEARVARNPTPTKRRSA